MPTGAPVLELIRKRVLPVESPVLWQWDAAAPLEDDWEPHGGEWAVVGGEIHGTGRQQGAGFLLSRRRFPGNVLLEFRGRTALPSTHDLDFAWQASWDAGRETLAAGYVAGFPGWWNGLLGVERAPTWRPVVATPCPWFEPGRDYFVQAGTVDGHVFLAVDGVVRLELLDEAPVDAQQHAQIGFEVYESRIAVQQITVRQPAWEPTAPVYLPE